MNEISVKNLTVSYSGVEAINNITLDIKKGEFVCIVGPNGGGKTTFLKAILGLLKKSHGEICFKERLPKIGYVPQASNIDRTFPLNVLEAVLTSFLRNGLHPFKKFQPQEISASKALLEKVGLTAFCNKQIGQLSGGEFQRLLIARALASNPEILMLDEPTSNVDIVTREKIHSLLNDFKAQGKTVIIITHDLEMACNLADKIICINRTLLYCDKAPKVELLNHLLYGCTAHFEGGCSND